MSQLRLPLLVLALAALPLSSCNSAEVAVVGTVSVFWKSNITGHELRVTLNQGGAAQNYPLFRFLSVPYAEPPIGQLRFDQPELFNFSRPDRSQIDATRRAASCPRRGRPDLVGADYNEDCLYMSVRSPDLSGKRPVLVVLDDPDAGIHAVNGDVLAAVESIVVVTISYRVGAIGANIRFTEFDQGTSDWQIALVFIVGTIGRFGGDPTQIVLAGHGTNAAAAVGLQAAASIGSRRFKFKRIVMLGGSIASPLVWSSNLSQSDNARRQFSVEAGCPSSIDLSCLRDKNLTKLLQAEANLADRGIRLAHFIRTDESVTPETRWRDGYFNGSVLIGAASDVGQQILDGINWDAVNGPKFDSLIDREFRYLPRLHSETTVPARRYLRLSLTDWPHAALGAAARPLMSRAVGDFQSVCPVWQSSVELMGVPGARAYVYLHDVEDPTGAHASDASYLIGEPLLRAQNYSEAHRNLSVLMMKHLAAFVRGDAPSAEWPQLSTTDYPFMRYSVAASASTGQEVATASPQRGGFGFGPGRCQLWAGELPLLNEMSPSPPRPPPAASLGLPDSAQNVETVLLAKSGSPEADFIIQVPDFGTIIGTTIKTGAGTLMSEFLGIPYAQPPVGSLRFSIPMPPIVNSSSNHSAMNFGPACMQPGPLPQDQSMSEDCLYLNVWTPMHALQKDVKNLPAIVFLHGGFFQSGSTADNRWLGSRLLDRQQVVVVTVAYRLGVFGFLALDTKTGPNNMGLWDQEMALEWVNSNIVYFGASIKKVTLMGVEAGAASVGYHQLRQRELFTRAVMLTGSPRLPQYALPAAAVRELQTKFGGRAYLNCPGTSTLLIVCMRKLNASFINEKQVEFLRDLRQDGIVKDGSWWPFGSAFLPVVEDAGTALRFFKNDPMTAKPSASIPLLMGWVDSPGNSLLDGIDLRNLTQTESRQLLNDSLRYFPRYPMELNIGLKAAMLRFEPYRRTLSSEPAVEAQMLSKALGNRFYTCTSGKYLTDVVDDPKSKPVYGFLFAEDRVNRTGGLLSGAALFEDAYFALGASAWTQEAHDRLSKALKDSLVAFADTGDPGWAAYKASSRRLRLMTTRAVASDQTYLADPDTAFAGAECAFWDRTLPCVDSPSCIRQPFATTATAATRSSAQPTSTTPYMYTKYGTTSGPHGVASVTEILIIVFSVVGFCVLSVVVSILVYRYRRSRDLQSVGGETAVQYAAGPQQVRLSNGAKS